MIITEYHFKLGYFGFLNQICPKRALSVQNKTNKHHHQIQHIRIILDDKFQFEKTILVFWTKFALKGLYPSETEQMNMTTKFSIFVLVQMPSFVLIRQFCFFFYQIYSKRVFTFQNRTDEQVSSYTENFDFLDQICPERLFLIQNNPKWKFLGPCQISIMEFLVKTGNGWLQVTPENY